MRDDFDDPQGYPASSPPFPGAVTAAGIIWIVFGGIILLGAQALQAIVYVAYGLGLLAAGVLALVGRDGYMAWREFHRPQRPRRPEYREGAPDRGEGPPDYRVQR